MHDLETFGPSPAEAGTGKSGCRVTVSLFFHLFVEEMGLLLVEQSEMFGNGSMHFQSSILYSPAAPVTGE